MPDFDFYFKLKITTLTPPAVFILLLLVFCLPMHLKDRTDMSDDRSAMKKRKVRRAQLQKLIAFTLFLMYPTVSKTVFSTFECRTVSGVSYLVPDFSLRCYSGEWNTMSIYSGIMIAMYSF